ncbi:MAG: CBS domain-containing protein [Pseudonocardia sp.]|nr:CBS domain-containing protein [Pseudonocardia sp.]
MTKQPTRLDAPPETLDDDPPLSSLMTRRLVGITPDASLGVALRLMATAEVRHLPVIDGGRCLGIVTEADVVRAVAAGQLACPGPPVPVAVLCRKAPTLDPHDGRGIAAGHMHTTGIDAVLITDDTRLIGIVTATDIVRSLARADPTEP